MYHYDPETALEEMTEEALLANPAHVRDMILRRQLSPDQALALNRQFQDYQRNFSAALEVGKKILAALAAAPVK